MAGPARHTLQNQWYFAAFDYELGPQPLARTIAEAPIVFWRRDDGSVAALLDACPHRFAPLSTGKLVGDEIECGYHGMRFDGEGRCTAVPSQDSVPGGARVRTFPVAERYGAIWIWAGEHASANPADIPDFFYHRHDDWYDMGHGMLPIRAHLSLVIDNLLDLSHIAFVHERTVGNRESAQAEVETRRDGDRSVTVERWIWNQPAVPLWRKAYGNYEGHVDHWLHMHWEPPGYVFMDVGVTPAGKPPAAGMSIRASHIITPADAESCYYFWCLARPHAFGGRAFDVNFTAAVDATFHEDQEILEAQQRRIDMLGVDDRAADYRFPVNLGSDAGGVHARRIMHKRLAEEADNLRPEIGSRHLAGLD